MVLAHVDLELVGIGARGWLPSRLFGLGVEVVGKVFGVGVADFPSGREAGITLSYILAWRSLTLIFPGGRTMFGDIWRLVEVERIIEGVNCKNAVAPAWSVITPQLRQHLQPHCYFQ